MTMANVLLISHGDMAKEVYETVKMIFGQPEHFDYLQLPAGCDLQEYKAQIIEHVENSDDGLLILADLFGGSPFMLSSQVFGDEKYNGKMELVTGLNMPMALEVASKVEFQNLEELKQTALESGVQGICDLRQRLS